MAPWHYYEHGRHNWRFIIIMCYLTLVAIGCSYAIWKVTDTQDKFRKQAIEITHNQCVTSNKARQVVRDLLDLAEDRTKEINNPNQTPEQKRQAIKFYEDAKAQIIITKCPPIR